MKRDYPRLILVGSSTRIKAAPAATGWTPRPYDLCLQPQRPGELCEELVLEAGTEATAKAEADAAQAGVPIVLWNTVAVEAARAATAVAEVTAMTRDDATARLDLAAADAVTVVLADARVRTRLTDYAVALLRAAPRLPTPLLGALAARPSLRVFTAWSRAATAAGEDVNLWALRLLEASPRGATVWEAAAAASGESMLEWALDQAARCRRSSSTAAHSRA